MNALGGEFVAHRVQQVEHRLPAVRATPYAVTSAVYVRALGLRNRSFHGQAAARRFVVAREAQGGREEAVQDTTRSGRTRSASMSPDALCAVSVTSLLHARGYSSNRRDLHERFHCQCLYVFTMVM
jgi:hypothetical protein